MKKLAGLFFIGFVGCLSPIFCQKDPTRCVAILDSIAQREVYVLVDEKPQFPGGEDSLNLFIAKELRYPQHVCIQGSTIISFIVEVDGSLSDVKIERGIGKAGDDEAIALVDKMPRWIPGLCQGNRVPVKAYVFFKFDLE